MKYYRITRGNSKERPIVAGRLVFDIEEERHLKIVRSGKWHPISANGGLYETTGHFTQRAREAVPKMIYQIGWPEDLPMPEYIAHLSEMDTLVDLFPQKYLDLFERLDPGQVDYLPIPRIWMFVRDAYLTEPKYTAVSFLRRINCLDLSKSWVVKHAYLNGMERFTIEDNNATINADAVADVPIWRDTLTNALLCNDVAREALLAISGSTLDFIEWNAASYDGKFPRPMVKDKPAKPGLITRKYINDIGQYEAFQE